MLKALQLFFASIYIILHFIISIIIGIFPAKVLFLLGFRHAADRILELNGRYLSRGIVISLGGVVHISGVEHLKAEGGRICLVSNHQSYVDIPLIVSYIPLLMGFVAKAELRRIPMLSSWMRALGCVYIDRTSARSSVKAIFDGVKTIKSGHPLVIFPEGTRSRSNGFGEFKPGSLKLATRAKAVILPVTIQNTYKLIEGRWTTKSLRIPIYLTIHPPIPTADLSDEDLKALPQRVYDTIESISLD